MEFPELDERIGSSQLSQAEAFGRDLTGKKINVDILDRDIPSGHCLDVTYRHAAKDLRKDDQCRGKQNG
jgi:hypothetical protein